MHLACAPPEVRRCYYGHHGLGGEPSGCRPWIFTMNGEYLQESWAGGTITLQTEPLSDQCR